MLREAVLDMGIGAGGAAPMGMGARSVWSNDASVLCEAVLDAGIAGIGPLRTDLSKEASVAREEVLDTGFATAATPAARWRAWSVEASLLVAGRDLEPAPTSPSSGMHASTLAVCFAAGRGGMRALPAVGLRAWSGEPSAHAA